VFSAEHHVVGAEGGLGERQCLGRLGAQGEQAASTGLARSFGAKATIMSNGKLVPRPRRRKTHGASIEATVGHFRIAPDSGRIAARQRTAGVGQEPTSCLSLTR
jgi:hypothetical protein